MKVQKRRRRENRTDYLKRMKLLKGEKPRIVFRRTNKYLIVQYVESHEANDSVKFGFDSRELIKYGWPQKSGSGLKNMTANYLSGFLAGKLIIKNKLEKPIIDFGMTRVLHKSNVYGFIKGLIDAGIKISCKKEALPNEDRINGEHLKNKIDIKKIKSTMEGIE